MASVWLIGAMGMQPTFENVQVELFGRNSRSCNPVVHNAAAAPAVLLQ